MRSTVIAAAFIPLAFATHAKRAAATGAAEAGSTTLDVYPPTNSEYYLCSALGIWP